METDKSSHLRRDNETTEKVVMEGPHNPVDDKVSEFLQRLSAHLDVLGGSVTPSELGYMTLKSALNLCFQNGLSLGMHIKKQVREVWIND